MQLTAVELDNLLKEHHTSARGLTSTQAVERNKKLGPNLIVGKKRAPLILLFLEEFKDLMVIILIFAAIFASIAGEYVDALIILFIVFLNAAIGFIQKYKAEKAIEALRKLIAPKAKVIRDGIAKEIDAKELVTGDILILDEGDSVTADAILFEINELEAQESALTGESIPVQKLLYDDESTKGTSSEIENMVFMGTTVTHGSGKAIVASIGMSTQMGKIAQLTTETKKDLSPLQKELLAIGVFVGKVAFVISAILLGVGLFQGKQFVETLLFATSVAVAAVPEGLPATITIALAIGVQRLAQKNAIVKQLSSVETLGSTTVICSDKTGTLTKNEMTVKEIYFDEYEVSVRGVGYNPLGSIHIERNDVPCVTIGQENGMYEDYEHQRQDLQKLSSNDPQLYKSLETFMIAAGICNNAGLVQEDQKTWKVVGDPTEGALLTMVEKSGLDVELLKKEFEEVYEIPFDSTRKRMTVIVKDSRSDKLLAFTKGAPDSVLENCTQVIFNGRVMKIDKDSKQGFLKENEAMAKRALRGLGFAYREITADELNEFQQTKKFTKEQIEKKLIFLGLVGMIDPPRPEVKEAVETAHKAGMRTYIITGDHGLTAEAIGKQLGIINEKKKYIILTGEKLNELNDKDLSEHLKDKKLDIIFARVSPEHKLRIVRLLKEAGEIVAVTGDGVNDAPALKRSDIGIAMGITGTDVSKEASNMVLADDSYATIVTAIKEGRTIYDNLKKFVFYIFSSNIGEVLTVFAAILLGLHAPLTAILILCINLGTDVLPAVALGVDPSEPGIMDKPPRSPKARIMNKDFIFRYTYIGIFIGIIVMVVYIWTLYRYGWSWGQPLSDESITFLKGSSIAFVLLVTLQMVNVFNSRSETLSVFKLGLFTNKYLLGAIVLSMLLTIGIVQIPFLQQYLHTTGLDVIDWVIVIASSFIILIVEEIRKTYMRRKKQTV